MMLEKHCLCLSDFIRLKICQLTDLKILFPNRISTQVSTFPISN